MKIFVRIFHPLKGLCTEVFFSLKNMEMIGQDSAVSAVFNRLILFTRSVDLFWSVSNDKKNGGPNYEIKFEGKLNFFRKYEFFFSKTNFSAQRGGVLGMKINEKNLI